MKKLISNKITVNHLKRCSLNTSAEFCYRNTREARSGEVGEEEIQLSRLDGTVMDLASLSGQKLRQLLLTPKKFTKGYCMIV